MTIERVGKIFFDDLGTLMASTRWISTHDEGIAEWLKNARRAYQVDRSNVQEQDKICILLLKDSEAHGHARIGLLDVGGATLEDIERWSKWNDPQASSRGSGLLEEETQGNGGKAYMFSLFTGPSRILGIADRTRNCQGFDGPAQTLDRGTPGFMPSVAEGREVHDVDCKSELQRALAPYGLEFDDLPGDFRKVVERRQRFTLVEGEKPVDSYRGRIDAQTLIPKVLRHDQTMLAVQQTKIYAIHNGVTLNVGKPLELEAIHPYPGLEGPFIYEIPEELVDEDGVAQSTTQGGTKARGRLILWSSEHNMPARHKVLRPRWKLSYSAGPQMLGSKSISELAPGTPGAEFIYGQVELETLAAYATHGRVRPKDGPLVQAVNRFTTEQIRQLAKQINDRRRHEQDSDELDDIHKENKILDEFKNKFMPSEGLGGNGNRGSDGAGPRPDSPPPPPPPLGTIPSSIELQWSDDKVLRVGSGVSIRLSTILQARIRDDTGRPVTAVNLEWATDNEQVARVDNGILKGRHRGSCNIHARVVGTSIRSTPVSVEVWIIDHVLLTPRSLDILLGTKETITAEVTNDQGQRATDVLLEWAHDADDQLILRINPFGAVFGNRTGRTSITAGARGVGDEPVWARVRVDIEVRPNPEAPKRGSGFPKLLLTDRDLDPLTGEVRSGSPDQATLWQEVLDQKNNIWWLNLQSEDAAFAFEKKPNDVKFWRMFHAQQVVEMVVQVHMQQEFTSKGDDEKPDLWLIHKQALERNQIGLKQGMWEELKQYVDTGRLLE
ncbi:MAG TPA: hypothetical protein VMZ30_21880 [Pyrinomonadaceae bacterium]|nr:hypothetical protein [Pyrinomonadaceae bacterium]